MPTTSGESRIIIDSESKFAKPIRLKGKILNDNDVDVDHLGRVIYAEVLAQQIEIIKSPVAVGIFSQWGTGKSFLLTHVQSILKFKNKRNQKQTRKISFVSLILFALSILGSTIAIFVSVYFATIFLAFLLLILNVFFTKYDNNFHKAIHFCKVIFYAFFTQLPIREAEFPYISTTVPHNCTFKQDKSLHASTKDKVSDKDSNCEKRKLIPPGEKRPTTNNTNTDKKSRRFIYVNYNAWQYEGCDTLWAGIVTTMAEKIEEEFGVLTTRIFRSLYLDLKEKPNVGDHCMCIEIKEDQENNEQNLKDVLKNYGNVLAFQKFEDWIKDKTQNIDVENKEKSFVVQFEHQDELKQAYHKLPYDKNCRVTVLENLKSGSENNEKLFCKHLRKHPRTGYILTLFALIFAFAVCLGRGISLLTTIQNESTNVVDEILVFLPAGLTFLYGILRFIYTLSNSYQRKITKALKGAKKDFSTDLGFMKNIKEEVQSMTNLIHAIELSHNIEYKLIITIDDLDRVPLPKVKSVLEAVSILLSDRNSPFICLIAIDPRIANACFTVTSKKEDAPTTITINGHEYLKKIINLPFCLQEIDNEAKCSFVKGLIDEADVTRDDYNKSEVSSTSPNTYSENSEIISEQEQREVSKDKEEERSYNEELRNKTNLIDVPKCLHYCRKIMYGDKNLIKRIDGNPRSLKRIFNIISMTASLIDSMQKREIHSTAQKQESNEDCANFANQLLNWTVLIEQWPFRMSYILSTIQLDNVYNEPHLPSSTALIDIYEQIRACVSKNQDSQYKDLLQLDKDPISFRFLLDSCRSFLTKEKAYELLKYTTNLDRNIMKEISLILELKRWTEPPNTNAANNI